MTTCKGSPCRSFLLFGWFHRPFFCASAAFQILKPFAPTCPEAILTCLPAEGTGLFIVGEARLKTAAFTVPKKTLPLTTKAKTFISVQAN